MNKLRKARWRNILRKAAKVNSLLKKGYIVFDENGHRAEKFQFDNAEKKLYVGSHNCRVIIVGLNDGWDSALDIPIKEYNADSFDKYTAIHPKHLVKI